MSLIKTCDLTDFPQCRSVAAWQEQQAIAAYLHWLAQLSVQPDKARVILLPAWTVNWSGCAFAPPVAGRHFEGPHAVPDDVTLSAVFALSVLDRHPKPMRFLREAQRQLADGGLIVCSFAYWNADGPDLATGHELRQRIYNRASWQTLLWDAKQIGLKPLGKIDWTYHGDTLGDHTLATIALTRGDHA